MSNTPIKYAPGPRYPASRQQLVDYCLRRLGAPVIQINVDEDQISDRIDDAFQYLQEYHFDGVEKVYLKHLINQQDIDQQYIDMTQGSGTVTVQEGNNYVAGVATQFKQSYGNNSVITINNETYQVENIVDNYNMFMANNFINSANGVNYYVQSAPDSIIGITRIFTLFDSTTTVNMFDLRYQLRLNELWDFTSTSYVNYDLTMQHLRTLEMLFTGEQPIRFNRHMNKLFIDWDWTQSINTGEYIIMECYRILDPNTYVNVYNDRFIKKLATAYIKRQWGENLSKYSGLTLPGGVQYDAKRILEEARYDIEKIEEDIMDNFMEPPEMMMG